VLVEHGNIHSGPLVLISELHGHGSAAHLSDRLNRWGVHDDTRIHTDPGRVVDFRVRRSFTELSASIADPGAPFGASTGVSGLSGTTGSDSLGATGYSVVVADSLDGAVTAAKGCPVLASGGAVDVYQLIEM